MTLKLDEIVLALEGEIKDQEVMIEHARRDIELANGRIKWATRVIRWLRSGTDPDKLFAKQLAQEIPHSIAPPSSMESNPSLHPCPYDSFVAATPRGLKHHNTVKHPGKPFRCPNHPEEK